MQKSDPNRHSPEGELPTDEWPGQSDEARAITLAAEASEFTLVCGLKKAEKS